MPRQPEHIELGERTGDQPFPRRIRKRVAEVLAGDGLVALPTETVYGIAARADSLPALEALRLAKDSQDTRGFTWHVGSRAAVEDLPASSPQTSPRAVVERLTRRYWPGPLTLVLRGLAGKLDLASREGWTGVRFPAHFATAQLLEELPFPTVMSSANRAGQEPLPGSRIPSALGSAIRLVIDDGPARMGEASAVLRVGAGRFELLREGLHDLEPLRRTAGLSIAFCCTGNTCRSPMAEGLAQRLIADRLGVEGDGLGRFGFSLGSMGAYASSGSPASGHALEVLAAEGLDLSGHRSSPATAAVVSAADRVYCMTRSHVEALRLTVPPGQDGSIALLAPDGLDIPDPIGGSLEDYRRCADRIRRCLEQRLEEWV